MRLFTKTLLALTLSAGLTSTGSAVVIWFSNVDIPIPNDFDGVYVDFETGSFAATASADTDGHFVLGGFAISNNASVPAPATPSWRPLRISADNTIVDNLAFGEMIGPTGPFSASGFADSSSHLFGPNATFTPGTQGYIGYKLEHSVEGTIYGWALVTLELGGEGTIHTFVWQDNGNPIPAGVPEPTAPLLAFLGVGALALRRRRQS